MSKEIIGTTTSGFQYRLETDIGEKLGQLEENALDFITQFNKGDFTYRELEMIARNLESTAQYFGEQYGLGGTRLLSETKARVNHYNDSIVFENKARDDYERYYAAFVEYGHRTKNGYFPARPFMRNALYTVSKASTGQVGEALADLLKSVFSEKEVGYQGIHKLTFGNKLGESYHYSKPNYQVVNSFKNALEKRQKGRTNKEFGDYSQVSKNQKQLSFTRRNRATKKNKKLASNFTKINNKAIIESKFSDNKDNKPKKVEDSNTGKTVKGVYRRNYQKKGPKKGGKKPRQKKKNGVTYTLPSFFD